MQCCLIDALPFEKCEIVATVVKKNAIYRRATNDGYDYKGKGRATEDDGPMLPEEVQLIFYECESETVQTRQLGLAEGKMAAESD